MQSGFVSAFTVEHPIDPGPAIRASFNALCVSRRTTNGDRPPLDATPKHAFTHIFPPPASTGTAKTSSRSRSASVLACVMAHPGSNRINPPSAHLPTES